MQQRSDKPAVAAAGNDPNRVFSTLRMFHRHAVASGMVVALLRA